MASRLLMDGWGALVGRLALGRAKQRFEEKTMTCGNGPCCLILVAGFLAARSANAEADRLGPPPSPPPEMVQACSGYAAGDSCSVTLNGHTIEGTCRSGPDAEAPLACFPKGPPPGVPLRGVVEACDGRAAGDSCSVTSNDRTIDGTCRTDPHRDGSLVCFPRNLLLF
jgi:hypothetical protein